MQLGVLTSLNHNIRDNLRAVRELGLDTCQLKCWNSAYLTDELAAETVAAAAEYNITITGFWVGWDGGNSVWNFTEGPLTLGIVPVAYRSERVKMLLRGAAFAKKIGVTDVITHAGFLPENPCTTEYHEIVSTIRYIAKTLLKNEQFFLFETGQETPVTLLRIIEEVGTGNLGINLDPANLLMYGKANAVDAVKVFGKYIRGMHGKDGEYPTDPRRLGVEKPLGQGSVDYPRLIAALKEAGYDGAITIEREIAGDQQIADILMAKAYLEELIK